MRLAQMRKEDYGNESACSSFIGHDECQSADTGGHSSHSGRYRPSSTLRSSFSDSTTAIPFDFFCVGRPTWGGVALARI